MKIKLLIPVVLSLLILSACKNNESSQDEDKRPESEVQFSPTPNEISRKDTVGRVENPSPDDLNQEQNRTTNSKAAPTSLTGRYIKDDQQEDHNCGCYCIDINFDSASELCLVKGTMYISARMEKNGNNINVYLVKPSSQNSEGKDIPWKDFDTNAPIATITPKENGEMELDWLGFTINGDLAMDYAIYGKKTLEGTYKKK